MWKYRLVVVLAIFWAKGKSDEISDCKCWEGYVATKTDEGAVCDGKLLLHSMPCNVVERPRCQCSGNVTGILSDLTGTYCVNYVEGKERTKWNCENKAEWDKFFTDYPDQKPKNGE